MMAEHWCKEHQTVWFKKGKMRGYAHPIKDENGEDTSEWCNEPKSEEVVEEEVGAKPVVVDPTRKSIERQTSLKSATEWCIAKVQGGEKLKTFDVLVVAKVFESYLDTGVVVEKRKK